MAGCVPRERVCFCGGHPTHSESPDYFPHSTSYFGSLSNTDEHIMTMFDEKVRVFLLSPSLSFWRGKVLFHS